MSSLAITTREVLRLQALSRLRWQLLLDLPRLADTVERELLPLARLDQRLERELGTWLRSALHPFPLDEYGRRTRRLADVVRQVDPLGRCAMALLRRASERLANERGPGVRLHHQAMTSASDRYIRARNALLVRGTGIIDDILEREGLTSDCRADAFQDAVFGLITAFEVFEPSEHVSFQRIARQRVLESLDAAHREFLPRTPFSWPSAA